MDLDRLLYLVSGWVLGMASSLLIDAVRRQRRLREIRSGLGTEVSSLRYLLAHLAYEFARRTGKWNRELLSLLLPALDLETEVALPTRMGEAVRGLLTGSDEHLAEAAKRIAPSLEASVSPRTYKLPYLEANIDAVALLGEEPRRKLLGIKAQLDGLNQAMADIRELNASTFRDLTPENRQRVEQNLQSSYGNVLERCLIIEELAANLKLS